MQKIILDTNVLVAALISRSYPYFIVKEVFENPNVEICLSEELFDEYVKVLARKRFKKYPDFEVNAQALLVDIETFSTQYKPGNKIDIIADKDDNKLLELVEASKAQYLVTGNTNDFTMKRYKSAQIVTPKQYWETQLMK